MVLRIRGKRIDSTAFRIPLAILHLDARRPKKLGGELDFVFFYMYSLNCWAIRGGQH